MIEFRTAKQVQRSIIGPKCRYDDASSYQHMHYNDASPYIQMDYDDASSYQLIEYDDASPYSQIGTTSRQ